MTTRDSWYPSPRSRDVHLSSTQAEYERRHGREALERALKRDRRRSLQQALIAHEPRATPGGAVTTIRLRVMAHRIREHLPLSWGMKMYLACIERGDTDTCYLCGCALNDGNRTADHVVPKARGGGDSIKNIRLACVACNTRKGDLSLAEYLARAVA